jgi:hypothetical protein
MQLQFSLHQGHQADNHVQKGRSTLPATAHHYNSLTSLCFDIVADLQLQSQPSAIYLPDRSFGDLDIRFLILALPVVFRVGLFLRKFKVIRDPPERMEAIGKGNGEGSELLHGTIADA